MQSLRRLVLARKLLTSHRTRRHVKRLTRSSQHRMKALLLKHQFSTLALRRNAQSKALLLQYNLLKKQRLRELIWVLKILITSRKWTKSKAGAAGIVLAGSAFFVGCDTVFPKVPSRLMMENGSQVIFSDAPCKPYWMYLRWAGIDRYLSRLVGRLCDIQMPKKVRKCVFKSFGKFYGINWNDFRPDIEAYPTFNDFFTRPLAIARTIHNTDFVSPVDGRVLAYGKVENNSMEQIKGVTYYMDTFLGYQPKLADPENSLFYSVIYLSPSDYHRFHIPTTCSLNHCRHFPGALLPVKTNVVRAYPGLFSINERVVLTGTWQDDQGEQKFFSYIAVGATDVGSIELHEDKELKTNLAAQDKDAKWNGRKNLLSKPYPNCDNSETRSYSHLYEQPLNLTKGQEVGQFKMGSTIVLVFEAKDVEWKVVAGQKILLGHPLVDIVE